MRNYILPLIFNFRIMEISGTFQKIIKADGYIIISELPGDSIKMKKLILDYASKNPSSTILYFSHVALKEQKIHTGHITFEDLLRLQEDIQYKFKQLIPFALAEKSFCLERIKKQMKMRTEMKMNKKVGKFKAINRLKNVCSEDIPKKKEKSAILKSKQDKKQDIKKQVKKTEPQLPRVSSNKQGNKIQSLLAKKIQKKPEIQAIKKVQMKQEKIEEEVIVPKKNIDFSKKLKVKYSTSDEEGSQLDEEKESSTKKIMPSEEKVLDFKMDIEEEKKIEQQNDDEDDEQAFQRMIAAKNKIKNNNKGKPENIQKNVNKNALESTSEKTPNPIKEKKVIPLKQKSKPTPTGNRSMFDFVKKKQ